MPPTAPGLAVRWRYASLTLLLALPSCTDAPTASPDPQAPPSLAMSPPVFVADNTVPLPPDNHPDNGILGKWFPAFTIPASSDYYLIKITGKISHDWNELCPVWQCPNTLDGATLGPLQGGAGGVALGYARPGVDVAGGASPSRYYAKQHPDGDGTAFVLARASYDRVLWASRSGLGTGCLKVGGVCDPNNRQPQYFLSGQQSVTLHSIPVPLSVTGPAGVATGQPGAFTATVVENLPADLDANGNKRVFWYFMEGDTLATPGGGTLRNVTACNTTLACSYAPVKNGRMKVTAYVHGHALTGYSQVVRIGLVDPCAGTASASGASFNCQEPIPALVLTCPASVMRTNTITCTVSAQPSGALTDIRWTFKPDPVMIHPKVGPVEMAGTVSETTTEPKWEGPLVLPGMITVHATLDSRPDSASTRVSVTERSWNTGTGPAPSRIELSWGAAPMIGASASFGENVHLQADGTAVGGFTLLGFDLNSSTPVPSGQIKSVPTGPNQGYQYVEQYEIRLNRAYRLNRYITPENPDLDIEVSPGVFQNRWDALVTAGRDPSVFRQRAIQHETYGSGATGHQDGLVQAVTGDVCGNAALRIERIAGSAERVAAELSTAASAALEFHSIGAGHHRVFGHMQGAELIVRTPASPAPQSFYSTDGQTPLASIFNRHICEYEGWGL